MKKYIGVLVIGVLLIGIGMSTMEVGSSNDNNNGVKINIPEAPINYSLIPTVNSSDYWDSLDDVNDTQFNNEGGTLTIDESWADGLWCALTGCLITGDFNVTGTGTFGNLIVDTDNYYVELGSDEVAGAFTDDTNYVFLADGEYAIQTAGDVSITGDLEATGTITAGGFIGDGSGLTNLPGDIDNDFHIFFNGSMYTNINYNLTAGDVDDVEVLVYHGRKFIFGNTFT